MKEGEKREEREKDNNKVDRLTEQEQSRGQKRGSHTHRKKESNQKQKKYMSTKKGGQKEWKRKNTRKAEHNG